MLVSTILVFAIASVSILVTGSPLARLADELADETGWGEAFFGAVFLGATTSLAGIVTSATAAYDGYAGISFSNAIGGIAVQTAYLAIADMSYRPANLEHAAASSTNMLQAAFLIFMLAIVIILISAPALTLFNFHLGSPLLLIIYVWGIRWISRSGEHPFWKATDTEETVVDEPVNQDRSKRPSGARWLRFLSLSIVVIISGYFVAKSGADIVRETGLSETLVGSVFTAIVTSLPELVTSLAAVRQRALTLAVGNIIGGNSFEILFLPVSDLLYLPGSIYHALGMREIFITGIAILITAIMLLGLLRREKSGIFNIGFESFLVLVVYSMGVMVLFRW